MCQCLVSRIFCKFAFLVHLLINLVTLYSWIEATNDTNVINFTLDFNLHKNEYYFLGGDVLLFEVQNSIHNSVGRFHTTIGH